MSICKDCIHTRVCGLKGKYEDYIKEFNELNKKYDIFEINPKCPEFHSRASEINKQKKISNQLLYDDYIRTFIETFNPSHQAHQSREDKTKK